MMQWLTKSFGELKTEELYQLLRLRSEVFVVEQQCVFLDMDNKDQQALHLMGWEDGRLKAYTRLMPPGLSYKEMSIGRVVTSPQARSRGAGRALMEVSIRLCREHFGPGPIRIGAQCYLEKFYASLGFRAEGEKYLEDGIEHVEMVLP